MQVVIHVSRVVSWTSIFNRQMMVVVDFFICWLEWFSTDWAVGGVVVTPPLFLGQPFHRDFLGQVFSIDGWCDWDLVQKLFSGVIPYIYLGWFNVLLTTAFHVDAALTWYVMLVFGDEGFWWRWFIWVSLT